MAKVTKGLPKRPQKSSTSLILTDLLASNIKVDGSASTLLDHIDDGLLHMTNEEKEVIKDIVENGAGISDEDFQRILDLIDQKADKDHNHNDANFTLLASQIIETADRKFVNNTEKQALSGVQGNIQSQVNILKALSQDAMKFKGRYNSYADMLAENTNPNIGDTVFIENDETQEGANTIYYFKNNNWIRIKKDKKGNGWVASATAPEDKNLLWVDISGTDVKIKWFDGASWINLSGLKTIPASNVIQEKDLKFVNSNSDYVLGNMREDKETGLLMYKNKLVGGSEVLIDDTRVSESLTFSSYKIKGELNKKQEILGFEPEDSANKGEALGYAPLDEEIKIDRSYLYDSSFIVNDEQERLAITGAVNGDTCYEESTTKLFIYSANKWRFISKGDAAPAGKNNFDADRTPNNDDDELSGYVAGSMWINKHTKKAFICTDSTAGSARWELMAGEVTLNIGEIIPYKVDVDSITEEDGKFICKIPKMDLKTDFTELTLNGHELILDTHYTLENRIVDEVEVTYIILNERPVEGDYLFGEIYKHDVKKAEEQMLKTVYDSNNNGKVDIAECSDLAKGIVPWTPLTGYQENQTILLDNKIYVCRETHISANSFDDDKWNLLISEPISLDNYSTDNLKESSNSKYVTSAEKRNIEALPTKFGELSSTTTRVSKNESEISTLKRRADGVDTRIDKLKFTNLDDTVSRLTPNAFLKVNSDGEYIGMAVEPRFPIDAIKDSTGTIYRNISIPEFKHMEVTNQSGNQYRFELKASSADLFDMPKVHEHGKVLVSDVNNQKYVLANKEELTMSIENFHKTIVEDEWIKSENGYETIITHDMSSEALIVSFVNTNKRMLNNITYEILDKSRIKIIAPTNEEVLCTINCSLGAGNGYWQYLMDWSKIDFVDDSRIRSDRAYSSKKLTDMLKSYAKTSDYYTKAVSNSRYAIKEYEHYHDNEEVLNNIGINIDGDITFKNKRLLTEVNPTTISVETIEEFKESTEIYDFKTLCSDNNIQAIVASELLIQNTSDLKECSFMIRDGGIDILSVQLKPKEVQKYHLGISNRTKVFARGAVNATLTISAF